MKKVKKYYTLSNKATIDLNNIFDYTESKYSFKQALSYTKSLETVFNHLLINPSLGKYRTEIKVNLYSIAQQEHIIFYRVLKDKIRIVRILHGSRDLPKQFKK